MESSLLAYLPTEEELEFNRVSIEFLSLLLEHKKSSPSLIKKLPKGKNALQKPKKKFTSSQGVCTQKSKSKKKTNTPTPDPSTSLAKKRSQKQQNQTDRKFVIPKKKAQTKSLTAKQTLIKTSELDLSEMTLQNE